MKKETRNANGIKWTSDAGGYKDAENDDLAAWLGGNYNALVTIDEVTLFYTGSNRCNTR